MGDSISLKVSLGMQDEVRRTLKAAVIVDDHAEGEKSKEGQMAENANLATTQGEHSNVEENAAIPDTSQGGINYDELNKDPLSKKFKIMTPIPNFPTPTPMCSIPPDEA
ncbi:hypothetical protein Tco_0306003, partial [Tanacetum coccineum]